MASESSTKTSMGVGGGDFLGVGGGRGGEEGGRGGEEGGGGRGGEDGRGAKSPNGSGFISARSLGEEGGVEGATICIFWDRVDIL